ncbi:metallophosphoesterase [Prevotella sp. P2-180]|uniref:metallophosphoesterase n=1 Tax=Prevotella sp. P2-180 TaxID=2024224 RepID=UPI000B961BA2|nr:metallophosphoesterase [Prevotella sp. P2-180]OYP69185.1 acid phosphatase [Prevotella sp. P2-180]
MNTVNIEIRRAERNFWAVLATIALSLLFAATCNAQTPAEWKSLKGDVSVFIANDLGRNGYYDQKPIAELMGEMADEIGPEAIVATGDVHHFDGVASVNDPLWMTNYELIYSHPELMISWYPVLGNHEYRGNTQAVIDYSKVSRRWQMPDRYYSKVFADDDAGTTLRVVFIDTTPLIDSYRSSSRYPDAGKQDVDAQLQWLDATLKSAKEDWVIVVGHHPIYAETSKSIQEQTDMQQKLLPILHKYKNVSMYVCGHIHNFQHIKKNGDSIDYVVNSAGSLSRKVKSIDGTVFCSPSTGFSVVSATKQHLSLYMIDNKGVAIHQVCK